jgi:hypothetical protein
MLLLGFALLLLRARGMSLWIDEDFTVRNAGQPTLAAVVGAVEATERRPPLSFILFHIWFALFPGLEWAWRWLPAAWTVLAIAASVPLAERVRRGSGVVAATLLALSPFLLLYGPMLRAYSLTLLLGLLLTLVVLRERPRSYAALAVVGVWTDYVIWPLVAAHALWRLWPGAAREGKRHWWAAFMVVGASALPLLGAVLEQSGRDMIASDMATSPLGVLLKLGYPAYAYLLGETLFPWSPLAWPGMLGGAVALLGLWRPTRAVSLLVLSALLPLLGIVALLTLVATDLPFVNVPSRAIVAAPLVLAGLAAGLTRLPRRAALPALALLLVASTASVANLFMGEGYINPIYAVPAREIAMRIEEEAAPGAVVIADSDTLLSRYLVEPRPLATDDRAALEAIRAAPAEVWLLTFGRDRTRVLDPDAEVRQVLEAAGWRLVEQHQYVLQDPFYRRLKTRLFGREAYEAKATLERWQAEEK